jgi:hypothetical protein
VTGLCGKQPGERKNARARDRRKTRSREQKTFLGGAEDLFLNGQSFDEVVADMIAESGSLRDFDRAVRGDRDFRFDKILSPIASAGGNITGQCVTRQSGNCNIVCSTDAAFEHAAAPVGNVRAEAISLNREPTHAAEFDIDDAACPEFNGRLCIACVADGLVEANPGLDLFLQFRVGVDVVPPERLLDHEEVESIEATQVLDVIKCVGGVGVYGKQDVRMRVANSGNIGEVLARLNFDFYALVAGVKLRSDFFQ